MKNTSRQLYLSLGLSTGLCISSFANAADEAALYELAPENSAFVRIVNNTSDNKLEARIGGLALKTSGQCHATAFKYVKPGQLTLESASMEWNGELLPNKAYTFVIGGDAVSVIGDNVFDNPRKAQFTSYNLTDRETITIKTADGSKTVIENISHGDFVSRLVNPIKIEFAAFDADTRLALSGDTVFRRGHSASLFICGRENAYLANWSHD